MLRPLLATLISAALAACTMGQQAAGLRTTEHQVSVVSTAPSMQGQPAKLYVREVHLMAVHRYPSSSSSMAQGLPPRFPLTRGWMTTAGCAKSRALDSTCSR